MAYILERINQTRPAGKPQIISYKLYNNPDWRQYCIKTPGGEIHPANTGTLLLISS